MAEIVIDSDGAGKLFAGFGPKFLRRARVVMEAHGQQYIADLKEGRLSGNPIRFRTGNLRRSFKSRTYESALLGGIITDVAPVGPGEKYAALQEFGGTVKPVKSKWLWIPIKGNMTAGGVARITPTEAINRGGFFSKNVFFGRTITKNKKDVHGHTIGGGGYKGATFNKGEAITPLFVLKKSVYVPGRMGANRLWDLSGARLVSALDRAAASVAGEA